MEGKKLLFQAYKKKRPKIFIEILYLRQVIIRLLHFITFGRVYNIFEITAIKYKNVKLFKIRASILNNQS